jgi:hypothetical protein
MLDLGMRCSRCERGTIVLVSRYRRALDKEYSDESSAARSGASRRGTGSARAARGSCGRRRRRREGRIGAGAGREGTPDSAGKPPTSAIL